MAKQKQQSEPQRPPQHQKPPGLESRMRPKPQAEKPDYEGTNKLKSKVALITGGDSGIGRAVAILFAKEGADVAIVYLNEHEDAQETKRQVEKEGRRCLTISTDIGYERNCRQVVERVLSELGRLDILVNNAAEQHLQSSLEDITTEQLERTFRTNIFSYFYMAKAALPHLKDGATVINTTSITAYRGSSHLLDYSSTKGAIVSFTRSLSQALAEKKIRVNAVAPGPVWTPLIPSSFSAEQVKEFGSDVPLGHAAQPAEIAPCYVFLASEDAAYMTGQVLHPNGGEIIGG